jgi:hypothetical protein
MTHYPTSWTRSPACASRHAANAPAPEPSNAPATTATASKDPVSQPASATNTPPPSGSTHSHPNQQDQLKLRGIVSRSRPTQTNNKRKRYRPLDRLWFPWAGHTGGDERAPAAPGSNTAETKRPEHPGCPCSPLGGLPVGETSLSFPSNNPSNPNQPGPGCSTTRRAVGR